MELAPTRGIIIEVNSETDFVARNDLFQGLVKMVAQAALKVGPDLEAVKRAPAGSQTIGEAIADSIATIGENLTLRRAAALSVGQGRIASYVHNPVADGLGKIGVLVALEFERRHRRARGLRPQSCDARRSAESVSARARRIARPGGKSRARHFG